MPTQRPLLLSAKIYLLRFVVSLCVASLLLFFSGPFLWFFVRGFGLFPHQHWLALGLVVFTLIQHLLWSFNMDPFYGLVNLPLLLLEIAGFGYYVPFIWPLSQLPFQLATKNCIVVYCALAIFLFFEALLQIGSLILYLCCHHVLLHHRALTAEEKLKPYQVIFGLSTSIMQWNRTSSTAAPKLSTQYYVSSIQMKFVLSGRIILLRIVLISSFASMALLPFLWGSIWMTDFFWFTILVFVILHHLVSCVNLEFDYGFADLAALLFEITNIAPYMTKLGSVNPWSSTLVITYTLLAWIIFVSLVLEALTWMGCLIVYINQRVWSSKIMSFSGQDNSKPYEVLFGHAAWKKHFSGETNIIWLSRGFFATILVILLLFSLVINVILGPIQETGITPTKDLRSLKAPLYSDGDTVSWNVVFITPFYFNKTNNFTAAVNVTPLWSDPSLKTNMLCLHDPLATYNTPLSTYPWFGSVTLLGFQVDKFYCSAPPVLSQTSFPLPDPNFTPDILINVNFTTLSIPVGTTSDLFKNSVKVVIGLTNDTRTVVDRTVATTLIPGTNLIGITTWELRQLLKSPRLSAFGGLFDSYEIIAVSRMLNVYPDPLASKNPLIQQSDDISTFRVTMQHDLSETRALQDYRSRSVLQGFSEVGGLWTFLTGVFAAIFGSSIIRILFGVKPISFFGLAHSAQGKEIRKACIEEYPKIMEQVQQPANERGVLSFICDQLIDLGFLDTKVEENSTHSIVYQGVDQVEMSEF